MQGEKNTPSGEAWIVTNGQPGMEAQGVAVAQATGMPFKRKRIRVKGPLAWLPARLQIYIPPQFFLNFVAPSSWGMWQEWLMAAVGLSVVYLRTISAIQPQKLSSKIYAKGDSG